MALSPEIRKRKIREIANKHGWTEKRAADYLDSLKKGLSDPEEAIIQALLEIRTELLEQPG